MSNIQFDSIPGSIRVPGRYIEFNTRTAVRGLPVNPQRMVLIAAMTNGSQAPLEPIQLFSDAEAADLFGPGSWAHLGVRQAFRNNKYLDLTVIGVADNTAGQAASGSVAIVGTASSAGVLVVTIGGKDFQLSIAFGDKPESIATRLANVLAEPDCPVSAVATEGVVALTAKCKGEVGNEISLVANTTASSLNLTVTNMAGGQLNADITPALDVIAGVHFNVIASGFSDDKNAKVLSEHIDAVSGPIEQRGCIGVLGWRGSMATGTTFTSKLNSGRVTVAWYKNAIEANTLLAAGYAAVLAFEEDPARPLNTLEVKGLTVTADKDWPLFAEFNSALYNGLSPLHVVANKVQIMRAISTYTKNVTGTDDPALLDITTIRTLDYVRKSVNTYMALHHPRDKLSSRTPAKVRSGLLDVLIKLDDAEIIEEVMANKDMLLVVRNANDPNRLDTVIPADVVNGLHVFAARIDLYL